MPRTAPENFRSKLEPDVADVVFDRIGLHLEAEVTAPAGAPEADLAELFITAQVTRGQGDGVTVTRTHDHKCGRCWRHLPEVTEDGELCARCDAVVEGLESAA